MKKIVFAICFICILIFGISIYKISKINNVNLDNISIPKYDFETYIIVTPANKLQVIDDSGKVLNDYDLENTIYTDFFMKYYNSDDMLFYGTSHDAGSKNYNVFGTYDIKTKEISYTESYRHAIDRTNFKIHEEPLYMATINPDRYRLYRFNDSDYLYDNKLDRGVRINDTTSLHRKYFPLTETTGFLCSGVTVYFVDFEKQTIINKPNRDLINMYSCGIYNDKLLAYVGIEGDSAEFLLLDEKLDSTMFCENINEEKYGFTSDMYQIKDDIVLISQIDRPDLNGLSDTMLSYVDLSKDTPEMINLTTIENNGKGLFAILYADEENVYIYSCPELNKSEFIILDVDTLEVVKTIPIDKNLLEMPQFEIPIIIRNYS